MDMTLRWFRKEYDSVTIEDIKQIPSVTVGAGTYGTN